MRELTVSDMQIIEIIKAVSMNAKVVIMDEPTSSITEGEVRTLFKQVNRLRDSGISIIYITHKMDEIMEIGDDASILRDGQLISTHKVQDLTKDQIITKMVGREMKDVYPVKTAVPGEIVLELKNLNKKVPLKTLIFRCARVRYWEWPDWLEPDGQRYSGLSSDWTSWTAVKFCMRENRSTSQKPGMRSTLAS